MPIYIYACEECGNTYEINAYKLRLDFCGRAGCTVGVPVLGADGCHFNPEKAKIYTTANQLINAVSYTVPKDTCVLSFQSGDRHICGYAEESCQSNSDCGGHTYGDKECNGRTLQTYGCISFGNPTSLEKDRLPSESGWGTDSSQTLFGKRCEIISSQQVQCCGDTDCGVNYFCDRSTWTCKQNVQCTSDYNCGTSIQCDYTVKKLKKPICSSGQCAFQETPVDCCLDLNCPTGYYCTAERKCAEKVAVCLECPYECCENQCEVSGGYFDKTCPSNRPFCVDNACKSEDQPSEKCEDCDAFAKSTLLSWIFPKTKCEAQGPTLIPPSLGQSGLTCVFDFIRLILLPIIFLFASLFGFSLFDDLLKKPLKNETARKIIALILSLITAFLISLLFYFIWWLGIIVFVVWIIIKAIVGKTLGRIKSGIRRLRR
jgi:hypothetical protein